VSSSSQSMPPSVAPLFSTLWQEAQNLHFDWQIYRQLFGTSQERLTLLARFGVRAFALFEYVLSHHVTLSIFRLLDPANQGRDKDNLSLERLVNEVKADHPPLGDTLEQHLHAMRGVMARHADLRNKVIAHRDLRITPTLYDGTSTVLRPSRRTVEDALGHLRRIMNGVEVH